MKKTNRIAKLATISLAALALLVTGPANQIWAQDQAEEIKALQEIREQLQQKIELLQSSEEAQVQAEEVSEEAKLRQEIEALAAEFARAQTSQMQRQDDESDEDAEEEEEEESDESEAMQMQDRFKEMGADFMDGVDVEFAASDWLQRGEKIGEWAEQHADEWKVWAERFEIHFEEWAERHEE